MSGLKKLLGGKRKSSKSFDGKKSGSTGSLPGLVKSSSNISLSASPIGQLGGYEVKEKDLSKLLKAAWQGDLQKLKSLSVKKTNWDENDKHHRTALHLASSRAYVEVIEFLISVGANVNVVDGEGKSPLMKACEISSTKVVEVLLKGGAQTNVYDINRVTPIHIASAIGNVDIGMLLYDHDAKIDAKDKNHITPLHLCCGLGHVDFAEFLISEYAPVDCLDNQKRTPLMAACIDGHEEIVRLLLDNNADVTIEDKNNEMAEHLAVSNNNTSIATMINEQVEKSKKGKQPLSPAIISNASKNSVAANLFSPAAQSLKEIFSSPGSSNFSGPVGNVFGGPVVNNEDEEFSKTEASQSEDLDGDDSWNDTETDESETSKKPKPINLATAMKNSKEDGNNNSNMVKESTTMKQQSLSKDSDSKPKEIVNENNKLMSKENANKNVNVDDSFMSDTEEKSSSQMKINLREKNPNLNLGSWADSDESNSEWGDEDDIEDDFLQALSNPKKQESKQEKVNKPTLEKEAKPNALLQVPNAPPPDIQLSTEFSDFDGISQPEESFSDLPLSDYNPVANPVAKKPSRGKQADEVGKVSAGRKTEKAIESEISDAEEVGDESKWDTSSLAISSSNDIINEKEKELVNTAKKSLKNQRESSIDKNDDADNEDDEDFDWDSSEENSLPSSLGKDDKKFETSANLKDITASAKKDKSPSKESSNKKPLFEKESEMNDTKMEASKITDENQTKKLSMQPEDEEEESDWDSNVSSNESEERLNPISPEPVSDFEPSSPDESDEDEFDIELENGINKPIRQEPPKSILQSNILSPRNQSTKDFDSEESEDDLENEFLKQLSTKHVQSPPTVKENKPIKPKSSPRQQMADLGFDIGTSVSSISDPECVKEDEKNRKPSSESKIESESLNLSSRESGKDDVDGELKLSLDSKVEETTDATETESEWEIERKMSKALLKKENADTNKEVANSSTNQHEETELSENEARRLAHEEQIAVEIEEELRNEILDDINNVVFSSDDDFSLSENHVANKGGDIAKEKQNHESNKESGTKDPPIVNTNLSDDGESDESDFSEGEFLDNVNQSKQTSPEVVKQPPTDSSKDQRIKAKLIDILDKAKSPSSSNSSRLQSPLNLKTQQANEKPNSPKITEADLAQQQEQLNEAIQKRNAVEKELLEKKEQMLAEEKLWRENLEKEEILLKERLQKMEDEKNKLLEKKEKEFEDKIKELERKKMIELENYEKEKFDSLENEVELRQREILDEMKKKQAELENTEKDRLQKLDELEREKKKKLNDELAEMENHIKNVEKQRLEILEQQEQELKQRIEERLKAEEENKKKTLESLSKTEQEKVESLQELHEKTLHDFQQREELQRKQLEEKHAELLESKENELRELESFYEEKKREKEDELTKIEQEKLENISNYEDKLKQLEEETNLKNKELEKLMNEKEKTYEELKKFEDYNKTLDIDKIKFEKLRQEKENEIENHLKELEKSLNEEFLEKEKVLLEKLNQIEFEHQLKLQENEEKLLEKQNEENLLNKSLDELRLQEKELREKVANESRQLDLQLEEKVLNLNAADEEIKRREEENNESLLRREKEDELLKELEKMKFDHSYELEKSKLDLEEYYSRKLKDADREKVIEIQKIEERIREEVAENTRKILESSFEEEQEKRLHELKEASRIKQEKLENEITSLKRLLEEQSKPSQVLQPIPVQELLVTADKHSVTFSAPPTSATKMISDDDEEVFEEIDVSNLQTNPPLSHTGRNDQLEVDNNSFNNTTDQTVNEILRNRNNALRNIDRLESTLKHERNIRTPTSNQRTSSPDNFLVVDFDRTGRNPIFNEMRREDITTPQFRRSLTHDVSLVEDLQDELHESRRQLDSYRERLSGQELVKQEMKNNLDDLHRKIESLSLSYNEQEKSKLDVELQLNSLRYKLDQEIDAKNIAERLCSQLKDQLNRCEKKLTREAESRQNLDLSNRKLQADLKTKEQMLNKLQNEITELHSHLDSERNSRTAQEELYEEHLKHYEALLFEAQKNNQNHAQAMSQLEVLSESRKEAEKTTDELKLELSKAKGDFTRVLSQLEETKSSCEEKVNKLYEKLEKSSSDLATSEKNLLHSQYLLENEKAKKEAAVEKATLTLENEINARKRADEELISLRSRLEHAHRENERLNNEKNKCEADIMDVKELSARDKHELEKEVAIIKDQLRKSEEKLQSTVSAMDLVKDELKKASHVLVEKDGEFALAHRDAEKTKMETEKLNEDLRSQRENNSKLNAKLESSDERIKLLQSEIDKLQKELLLSKEQYLQRDKLAVEKHSEISDHVMTIKDQFNKENTELVLKVEHLNIIVEKLQREHAAKDTKIYETNFEITKSKENLKDTRKELVGVQSKNEELNNQLESMKKEKIELEKKIEELLLEVSNIEREKQRIELQNNRLSQELDKSKQITEETSQRLVKRTADVDGMRSENLKLRGELDDMRKENVAMETTLREEKTRFSLITEDLQSANDARESLEKLLSNIKQNNVSLEEKLQFETLHRSQREKEVEEHKGLWESEVKSRSKLGMEMLEKEKLIDQLKGELDNEKRKTRRALELKKAVDNKLEIYEQRSGQHQKETTALRSKLKQYQKRIKEFEEGNSRIPSIHAEFDKERVLMGENVSKLRQQLDQLSNQLSHEQNMRRKAEETNKEQIKEINDLKTEKKVQVYEEEKLLAKCRSLESELEKQKRYYERNFIPQEEIEDFKKALETKARIDLNKKLQEVNMHLEEQALAREAFDKLRSEKESKAKKELEHTIQDLKFELSEVRTTLHEGLAKRDTSEVEAKRFKELYKSERDAKDKLTDQLAKTAERLSLERSRTNYLFDETINKSKVTKRLFDEAHEKDRHSLSPRNRGDNEYYPSNFQSTAAKLWSTPGAARSRSSPERDYLYYKQYANLLT